MKTIARKGATIAFHEAGSAGPAVIFCHGFLMDRHGFAPQVQALLSKYRCILWDQRGFGDTLTKQPFTLWDSADDAWSILDELGIEKVAFIGASQGGYVAMRAALRQPERVTGLVMIGSEPGIGSEEARVGTRQLFDAWASDAPWAPIAQDVGATLFSEPNLIKEWSAKWFRTDRKAINLPGDAVLAREDLTRRLSEVTQPTLLINGENDPIVSLDVARDFRNALPNCKGLVIVNGAAHAPYLTHPQMVTPAIEVFLSSL